MNFFFGKYFVEDESIKRLDFVWRGMGKAKGTGRSGSLINIARDGRVGIGVDEDEDVVGPMGGPFLTLLLGKMFGWALVRLLVSRLGERWARRVGGL